MEAEAAKKVLQEEAEVRQQSNLQLPENSKFSGSSQPTSNPQPEATSPPVGGGVGGGVARKSGIHDLVSVTGGTFMMGSPKREKDREYNECQHSVTVKNFSIGKYEVTQADWREVMSSDPPELNNKGCDDCPVENVSWNDVQDFLKKLNARYPGKKYRLPTEEEWEYAARGGTKNAAIGTGGGFKYAGSNDLGKVAWYVANAGSKTHPVGGKAANQLGLYDMSGNVDEWCQDNYGPYPGCTGNEIFSPVLRGGRWDSAPQTCRPAYRGYTGRDDRHYSFGFRLALSL
jgi:formylglycine-generating enzyme required for sulfatase activity